MQSVFKRAVPYADDALNLPVHDVESATPYYVERFGFQVVSRRAAPHPSVILAWDNIQIGLAENGGDPTQEGCFFEVDDVDAAFREIKGHAAAAGAIEVQLVKGTPHRVFFEVAPDGLCYMIAQRQAPQNA